MRKTLSSKLFDRSFSVRRRRAGLEREGRESIAPANFERLVSHSSKGEVSLPSLSSPARLRRSEKELPKSLLFKVFFMSSSNLLVDSRHFQSAEGGAPALVP